MRNCRRRKTHRGTERDATGRDGALKSSQSFLESSIFWRIHSKFPNISGAGHPHPHHPIGGGGKCETSAGKKDSPRTPRSATTHDEPLKFTQPAVESSIFWRVPLEIPNNFGSRNPFTNAQRRRWELQRRSRRKDTAERCGA